MAGQMEKKGSDARIGSPFRAANQSTPSNNDDVDGRQGLDQEAT